MIKTEKTATVYRFCGKVAFHTESGQTVYLTPEFAAQFAGKIMAVVMDVAQCPKFIESTLETAIIKE